MSTNQSTTARKETLLKLSKNALPTNGSYGSIASYFESNVFNDKVMRENLPKDTYKKLRDTIRKGDN